MNELVDVELRMIPRTVGNSVDAPFPFRVTVPSFVLERLRKSNTGSLFDRLVWKPSPISYFKNCQKYFTVSLQNFTPQDIHRICTMLRNESKMVLRNWKD